MENSNESADTTESIIQNGTSKEKQECPSKLKEIKEDYSKRHYKNYSILQKRRSQNSQFPNFYTEDKVNWVSMMTYK